MVLVLALVVNAKRLRICLLWQNILKRLMMSLLFKTRNSVGPKHSRNSCPRCGKGIFLRLIIPRSGLRELGLESSVEGQVALNLCVDCLNSLLVSSNEPLDES